MGAENRVSKGVGELVKGEGEKGSQKKSGAESTSSNQPIQLDSPAWPSPFSNPLFTPPFLPQTTTKCGVARWQPYIADGRVESCRVD